MRKLISFVHISLDGFVAGPKGEMNWIQVDEEIFGHVGKRIGDTDTALYGRVTYDMMEGYWPNAGKQPDASEHDIRHSKWYAEASKIVLSRSMKGASLPNTTIISDDLVTAINAIKNSAGSEILVFGSPTATHALLEADLIDGFWLFVNPIVLGAGIPLFPKGQSQMQLQLEGTQVFTSGVTELRYVRKS